MASASSGINNLFNENSFLSVSTSDPNGSVSYCYIYNVPSYSTLNKNYTLTFEYYIFQQTNDTPCFNKGTFILYPTRSDSSFENFYIGYFNNNINNNFNYDYTGPNAPYGRWLWNTDFAYNIPSGYVGPGPGMFMIRSTSNNITVTIQFPNNTYNTGNKTDGYIKLLSRDENLSSCLVELSNIYKNV